MSKEPELPPELVKASLDEHERFAKRVVPYMRAACAHAKTLMGILPPGGARFPEAERQLYPAYVRMAMHHLIEGHNRRAKASGGNGEREVLRRRHVRNGAVCLVMADAEFRMLKASPRHPTRPSGRFQEALITQKAYWDLINGQAPLIRMDKILLNGLIYYQIRNMELLDAYVVIPSSFNERGHVVHAGSRPIDAEGDLSELATFDMGEPIGVLHEGDVLAVTPEARVPDVGTGDPYGMDAEVDDVEEIVSSADESVLDDAPVVKSDEGEDE